MEVTAFDARVRLPALLDRVVKGESITITRDGRPVAELRPVWSGDRERLRRAITRLEDMRRQRVRQRQPLTMDEVSTARNEGRK